jgi:O-antigen/teichoic acid export membrane protein
MIGGLFLNSKSRTQYSAYNTSIALFSRAAAILMGYVVRVVFTHVLSENYVGINGLFTDILNVLSLSEMGIETAISFALYKPIADGNTEAQKSIMHLYQWFYRFVAVFVAAAGICVIPFMDILIKNKPDIPHLTYIYILYLFNTVLSYLFVYKRTLLDAHQLMYIGTLSKTISWVLQDIVQIAVLLLTKNFILYLYVYILTTLFSNIYISKKAERIFPFLRDKNIAPVEKQERKHILKNIRAMMMHKIGDVIVNNTDNLLISSFVGIASVGCYSNYYLLIGSVQQVLNETFQGITASVGNLGATASKERVQTIFSSVFLLNHWLFSFAAICLFELLNPFIVLSFGEKYLFTTDIVWILCINFYIRGLTRSCLIFRNSLGLFWYDRYKSIAEALINLIVSIILAQRFGTFGVFMGTFISTVTTTLWIEPFVLYKYHFQTPVFPYYRRLLLYCIECGAVWLAAHFLCEKCTAAFHITGIIPDMTLRLVCCTLVVNFVFIILYKNNDATQLLLHKWRGLRK